MINRLIWRAALINLNLPEAAILTDLALGAVMECMATTFFAMGTRAVLQNGGMPKVLKRSIGCCAMTTRRSDTLL